MKEKLNDILRNLSIHKKVKVRQRLFIFFFFLLASFIFWLLINFNSDHPVTVSISYPVEYNSFPRNKVIVNNLPSKLSLNIQGKGYALLRLKLNERNNPIEFNVRSLLNYQMTKDTAPESWYLLMKSVRYLIQRQLGEDLEIVDVLPDTIFFHFSDVVHRKLPVEPKLTINAEQQYILSGYIHTIPESVMVTGPSRIIDTLKTVHSLSKTLEHLTDTQEFELELTPLRYVTFEPPMVKIIIPVERFTEAMIDIPVRAKNVPNGYFLKTFPSSIKVTYHVALNKYSMVKPEMFVAEADYVSYKDNINKKLKVTLIQHPDFIEIVDYKPKNVDFIIEK